MPQNPHVESVIAEEDRQPESVDDLSNLETYRAAGADFSARLGWLPGTPSSLTFMRRARRLRQSRGRLHLPKAEEGPKEFLGRQYLPLVMVGQELPHPPPAKLLRPRPRR